MLTRIPRIATFLLCILIISLSTHYSEIRAQSNFEGVLTYTFHERSDSGEGDQNSTMTEQGRFELVLSPDLILFDKLDEIQGYQPLPMMQSPRIYVRLDHKDFVFLQSPKQGFKVSKAEIVAMMELMKQMQSSSSSASSGNQDSDEYPEVDIRQTEETKTLQGYNTRKFILTDREHPEEIVEVWLADDMQIEWGMLAEPWGESAQDLFPKDMPLPRLLRKGGLPLLVERKSGNTVTHRIECSRLEKQQIRGGKYDLPSNVKLRSFQEMMMGGQ